MNNKIYLTIDIECHDISRKNQYIDGKLKNGTCGLEYIFELSKKLQIPVNCFLDIPEANEYGEQYVKDIIGLIHKYGHHVYLHLHPDYITGDHNRSFLWQYSDTEKREILVSGFNQYRLFLGHDVRFFRVGRYGADLGMYKVLSDIGESVTDLSYCSNCPKMCHVSDAEINTRNTVAQLFNQTVLPNTRYLGLKLLGKKVYLNLDASDTTLNEFKKVITVSNVSQMVLTMHSWNFIKKYFFLKNYITLDKYEERKFIKMVQYARSKGFKFCDLCSDPPVVTNETDTEIDICNKINALPAMIMNNYIRYLRIGRLNKKYFLIYCAFHVLVLFVLMLLFYFLFFRGA